MWQLPHARRTQRARLRRMGMFACLAAVLLAGFFIGRNSREGTAVDQIYLDNAGPARATPTDGAAAGRADEQPDEQRAPLARAVRPTASQNRRPRPSGAATPSTGDRTGPGGPSRYLLNGDDAASSALAAMEREVVRLINVERRRAGCGPLRMDRRLARSAGRHSAEMAARGALSHTSPDGTSPWERMEAAGYRDGGAENIGRGYTSPDEAVANWMKTSGHRRNILNCELRATGVGAVQGVDGPWWTQDFGYS
ncbi:CAP domain-containing protein [Streptosporangium sp. NPDC050855]|uniref:CAP domain-containing protein n=1 Tax=Streptosporangium sp. NPDC050855 TaxID=3366194 RepID=UPI0037A1E116